MKNFLKYLAVAAVLLVPAILFQNRISVVLVEFSLIVVAALSLVNTHLFKKLGEKNGYHYLYASVILSFLIGLIPVILNFGIFKPVYVTDLVLIAIVIGFVSAGLYEMKTVQKILVWAGLAKSQ